MPRDDKDLTELLPAYVLGSLEGAELEELERRLEEGAPELEQELREWTRQLEKLAESAEPVEPAPTTRASLLRRIEASAAATAATPTPAARRSSVWPAWAAAAALALVTGWSAWTQSQLSDELADLKTERQRFTLEIEALRTDLERTNIELQQVLLAQRIVSAPAARSTVLAGLDLNPGASARTFHDPAAQRAVFYASGLPVMGAGSTYQLWFIGADGAVPAGIFDVDVDGSATILVENVADPSAIQIWAVTVEPAGGVPQPTGAMVLRS